jgi:hypothetical protein
VNQDHRAIETLIRIDENVKQLVKRGEDHELRIRKVEKKQWYHTGGIAIVGFIAAKLGLPWPALGSH